MEILIQSLEEKAAGLNSVIHIRYWTNRKRSEANRGTGEDGLLAIDPQRGKRRMDSYVIIQKPHSYLEPVVRKIFEGAEDVQVVVDRRWHERRHVGCPVPADRRTLPDRRVSAPMLDVLINVDS